MRLTSKHLGPYMYIIHLSMPYTPLVSFPVLGCLSFYLLQESSTKALLHSTVCSWSSLHPSYYFQDSPAQLLTRPENTVWITVQSALVFLSSNSLYSEAAFRQGQSSCMCTCAHVFSQPPSILKLPSDKGTLMYTVQCSVMYMMKFLHSNKFGM